MCRGIVARRDKLLLRRPQCPPPFPVRLEVADMPDLS